MAYQQRKQAQINKQQARDVQILKSQLDSTFKCFDAFLQYLTNTQNPDQSRLTIMNDTIVGMLEMFNKVCESHKKNQNEGTLIAAWNYFQQKKESLNKQQQGVVSSWLTYAAAAITAEQKLPEFKIARSTIQLGQQSWNQQNVGQMFEGFLAAKHRREGMMQQVEQNHKQHDQQNAHDIKRAKQSYQQYQQTVNVNSLTQAGMHAPCGAASVIQFANVPIVNKEMN
eukprot:UN02086